MMTRILLIFLCLGVLSTGNGCSSGPAPYGVSSGVSSYEGTGVGAYQGEPSQSMGKEEERQYWILWREEEREREQERTDQQRESQQWESQREAPYDWRR